MQISERKLTLLTELMNYSLTMENVDLFSMLSTAISKLHDLLCRRLNSNGNKYSSVNKSSAGNL